MLSLLRSKSWTPYWLLLQILAACPALSLRCFMCRHTGLSMTPTRYPRSRLAFSRHLGSCPLEQVTCRAGEVCLFAATNIGFHRWTHSGCVPSPLTYNSNYRPAAAQQCHMKSVTKEDLGSLPEVLQPIGPRGVRMEACYCHDNLCNTPNDDVDNGGMTKRRRSSLNGAPQRQNKSLNLTVFLLFLSSKLFLYNQNCVT